ncbi:hypothetical protein G9A89_009036 [Geosiphon pyriformis]|nr:hypothetical protein G9A89_009036 [Geosiphon pyriformis]
MNKGYVGKRLLDRILKANGMSIELENTQSILLLSQRRKFSSTPLTKSHIGRAPILYPPEVTLTHDPTPIKKPRVPSEKDSTILTISGPLATHTMPIKPYVRLKFKHPDPILLKKPVMTENNEEFYTQPPESTLLITVEDPHKKEQRAMWGTTRALIANYVTGVSEGFKVSLRMVGVGYRASMDGAKLVLRVGFIHPVELEVPKGITCVVPISTRILLTGTDWREVKQFAANIRMWRKPEPYNQKGIFVGDETIKKKISRKK